MTNRPPSPTPSPLDRLLGWVVDAFWDCVLRGAK